jgi:hypothetical protein
LVTMKRLSFVFITLFFTVAAFSQKTQFGVKAGVNLADVKDDLAPDNTDSKVGFHVGGLAHIHLSESFAVQPEVMLSSQGAKYTLPSYSGETQNYYINVPVLLQYMVKGLRLQTGPQVGFLLSSKFKPSNGGAEGDLKDIARDVNLDWSFGAGYLTPSGLGLDARYNLGLANMYQDGRAEAKSRVWQVGLFYQFKH